MQDRIDISDFGDPSIANDHAAGRVETAGGIKQPGIFVQRWPGVRIIHWFLAQGST